VNELEFIVGSESENNSDDDDDTNDADDEGSDEQREEEEISNMTSYFVRILDLFEEPEEELNDEADEEITLADMSNEVVALKYDDGEEY